MNKNIVYFCVRRSRKFSGDLFSREFSNNVKIKICKNVEQYLNSINKSLKTSDSYVLNAQLKEVWKYMNNPKKLFHIISEDLIIEFTDEKVFLAKMGDSINKVINFFRLNY